MKGAWRALWERRPRLGHKGRAARNLLLVLALAVLVWGQYGCPTVSYTHLDVYKRQQ